MGKFKFSFKFDRATALNAVRLTTKWLREHPHGFALTICLSGLTTIFALPWLTLLFLRSPHLILIEVLAGPALVSYVTWRLHGVSWKVMASVWGVTLFAALVSMPKSPFEMRALAISGHLSGWFIWGLAACGIAAYVVINRRPPAPSGKKEDEPPRMAA
ncbi:MAG: hypothetical protein HC902_12845 [Calothrix sp. SM1_5_4]|nr:hypothetical protein [Calothrix sp. SM1_5_4]